MRVFCVTAMLLFVGCTPSVAPEPIVGAWRSEVQFKSGPIAAFKNLEFMFVFHADGTLTESSNYDASPPTPPAYGAWRAVGPREFQARYEYFLTTPPATTDELLQGGGWAPAGRGVFTERISVAADGRTFTSTLRFEAFDADGKPAPGTGDADGRGTRIEP